MASTSNASPIKTYSREEVKKHNQKGDLWIVLDNSVYDLSEFVYNHPGGDEVLMDRAGLDGTDCFDTVGHTTDAKDLRKTFKIGEIMESEHKLKHQAQFDGEYGRKFEIPKNTFYDYIVPGLVVVVALVYYFVL